MRAPVLVLRKFKINGEGGGDPSIEIVGRPSGLVAWILTIVGLEPETRLTVTDLCVSIKGASLSGEFNNFVPLPHVSSTHCGFTKPIGFLIFAAALAMFGIYAGLAIRDGGPMGIACIVVGLLFVIPYFLSRRISIEIVTDGGIALRLNFKPSVVEGVQVNFGVTARALALLNEKVLAAA